MDGADNKGKVVVGTLSLGLTAVIVKIVGALYKVPLSYMLGDEGMGYFNTAYTVFGFFYLLFASGLPKAIVMVINEQASSQKATVRFSLNIAMISGGILSVLIIIFAPMISTLLGNPSAVFTLVAIAPSVLFVCGAGVLRGYANARLELQYTAMSQLIESLSKMNFGLAFAYIGIYRRLPLYAVSALTVLGITIGSVLAFTYLYKRAKISKKDDKAGQINKINKRKVFNSITNYSIPISLGASLLSISGIVDMKIILSYCERVGMSSAEASSVYGNYSTLVQPMIALGLAMISPITVSGLSVLHKHFVTDEQRQFSDTLNRLISITLLFSVPMTVGFISYPLNILDILFSSEQSARGASYLVLLAPSLFLLSLQGILNTALEASSRIKYSFISLATGVCVKIAVCIIMILFTDLGLSAIPLSTVAGDIIGCILSIVFLKFSKISITVSVKPFIIAFLSILLPRMILFRGDITGASFVFAVIISILLYLVITVIFYISDLFVAINKSKCTKGYN